MNRDVFTLHYSSELDITVHRSESTALVCVWWCVCGGGAGGFTLTYTVSLLNIGTSQSVTNVT